jgi:hypothetical protein
MGVLSFAQIIELIRFLPSIVSLNPTYEATTRLRGDAIALNQKKLIKDEIFLEGVE